MKWHILFTYLPHAIIEIFHFASVLFVFDLCDGIYNLRVIFLDLFFSSYQNFELFSSHDAIAQKLWRHQKINNSEIFVTYKLRVILTRKFLASINFELF